MKNVVKDASNISGRYKRDVNDYEWLCKKCHNDKDGITEKFIAKARIIWLGKHHTAKTKEKMSEKRTEFWRKKHANSKQRGDK